MKIAALSVCMALFTVSAQGASVTIDFEDIDPPGAAGAYGPLGSVVGDYYATLGIAFNYAQTFWSDLSLNNFGAGRTGWRLVSTRGEAPTALGSPDESFFAEDQAIVVTFDSPVHAVDITAINVGAGGARIDAYGDPAGDQFITSSEVFGSGTGGSNNPRFGLTATGIRRLELYSPFGATVANRDGIFFDDLTVSFQASAPVLSSFSGGSLSHTGLSGVTAAIDDGNFANVGDTVTATLELEAVGQSANIATRSRSLTSSQSSANLQENFSLDQLAQAMGSSATSGNGAIQLRLRASDTQNNSVTAGPITVDYTNTPRTGTLDVSDATVTVDGLAGDIEATIDDADLDLNAYIAGFEEVKAELKVNGTGAARTVFTDNGTTKTLSEPSLANTAFLAAALTTQSGSGRPTSADAGLTVDLFADDKAEDFDMIDQAFVDYINAPAQLLRPEALFRPDQHDALVSLSAELDDEDLALNQFFQFSANHNFEEVAWRILVDGTPLSLAGASGTFSGAGTFDIGLDLDRAQVLDIFGGAGTFDVRFEASDLADLDGNSVPLYSTFAETTLTITGAIPGPPSALLLVPGALGLLLRLARARL